jgi:uncharacterized protein
MSAALKIDSRSVAGRYGPWAVVTGASDGIGKAFADALAKQGMNLVLVARRREILESLARSYSSQYGIQCHVLAVDLARPDAAAEIGAATTQHDVGLLVASAGFGLSGPFLDNELADEIAMIDVNCRALASLTHIFGRRMAQRGRGGIVLLSSLLAFQGVPGAANYAATKAYVQSLAEGLRSEMAANKIDVLSVAPGPIASGFAKRADMTYSMSQGPEVVAQQALKALGKRGTLRPGYLAKALELSLAPLPRRGRVMIMRQVAAGMANKKA